MRGAVLCQEEEKEKKVDWLPWLGSYGQANSRLQPTLFFALHSADGRACADAD